MRKVTSLALGIVLLILGILAPGIMLLRMMAQPPAYISKARILLANANQAGMTTEVEKILSDALLRSAITNLDLARKWGEKYKEGPLGMEQALGELKRSLVVRMIPTTRIIEISYKGGDPMEAADIVNRLVEAYRGSALAAPGTVPAVNVQILEAATPSLRPARPNPGQVIFNLGGLGCFLLIAGLLVLRYGREKT